MRAEKSREGFASAAFSETGARARAGDRQALEEVLASVAPAIHRFGLRMCKNPQDADDVLQDRTPDPSPSPESRAGDAEIAHALSEALDGLPEAHREVILLRDIEGLSAAEVALTVGISVDAVKSRLHRAREALRTAL